jgi:hypothetical protein
LQRSLATMGMASGMGEKLGGSRWSYFWRDNTECSLSHQEGLSKWTNGYAITAYSTFLAYFDMIILIEHIPGIADQLSCNHMQQFVFQPTGISAPNPPLIRTAIPDWTSPMFTQLFNITVLKVYLLLHKALSHSPNAMRWTNHHYLCDSRILGFFLRGF